MYSRVAVLAGVTAAAVVTAVTGAPHRLPDLALDSSVLFHLERVVALLAGYMTIVMLVIRAWSGQLPTELSAQGLKYTGDAATTTARALADLAAQSDVARMEITDLGKRIEALEKRG
jgi:hypothetical protein